MKNIELENINNEKVRDQDLKDIGFCKHKDAKCCIKAKYMEAKESMTERDEEAREINEVLKNRREIERMHEHRHGHCHHREHGEHRGHGGCKGGGRRPHFNIDRTGLQGKLMFCGRNLAHKKMHGGSQEIILKIILNEGEITQKDLQNILNIKGSSLSELISKLDNKGFIIREKYEKDNRIYILKLTEKGKEFAKGLSDETERERDKEIFKALSDEQREQLDIILDTLLNDWYGEDKNE